MGGLIFIYSQGNQDLNSEGVNEAPVEPQSRATLASVEDVRKSPIPVPKANDDPFALFTL